MFTNFHMRPEAETCHCQSKICPTRHRPSPRSDRHGEGMHYGYIGIMEKKMETILTGMVHVIRVPV